MPLHLPPWVSWHSEVLAFLALFLLAWSGILRASYLGHWQVFNIPFLTFPLFGIAMLAACQYATGFVSFGGDTVALMLYLVLCVMCVTLGFAAGDRSGNSHVHDSQEINFPSILFAQVLLFAAFTSAIVAYVQAFELWEQSPFISRMSYLRRPGGNLGQPNHLATLLLLGVVSLLFLYESRRLHALTSTLILSVLCVALAATESRTGVLSFLLLLGWWFLKSKKVGFHASPWAIALAGIGFLGFSWAWPSIFSFLLQSSGTGGDVTRAAGSRLVIWPQLIEAMLQRPWWGWGLGEIPKAHNSVAHNYAVSEPFTYSHNILLDLALGMGVPLTVFLALAASVWFWRHSRRANQLLPWYYVALILPVAVHSMLEFPFAYAYFLVPVMLAVGALEGLVGSKHVVRVGVSLAAAFLLGVTILAAWSVVEYVAIEEDFRVARFEALRVGQTPLSYQRPEIVLLTQLGALLDGARISPKPGMTADQMALTKKIALRYPWTATQNQYALSLALNGDPEEAVRQLRVMKAMHGEKTYAEIKAYWNKLAQDGYPQLRELKLP